MATPVGRVFAMYAGNQGGRAVQTVFSAPTIEYDGDGKAASFWGLRDRLLMHDKELILTAVNPHLSDSRETEIAVRGAALKSGSATTDQF